MIAMIEDPMNDTLLILRPPAAEPALLPESARTTTEPRRLGITWITVVVRRRLPRRVTRTNTLEADLRT